MPWLSLQGFVCIFLQSKGPLNHLNVHHTAHLCQIKFIAEIQKNLLIQYLLIQRILMFLMNLSAKLQIHIMSNGCSKQQKHN